MRQTLKILLVVLVTGLSTITANNVSQSSPIASFAGSSIEALKALHKKYGPAKLILKDRSVYKKITVHEVNAFWLVFLKNGSLHDMLIEKIARIQYGKDDGPVVKFNKEHKVVINY